MNCTSSVISNPKALQTKATILGPLLLTRENGAKMTMNMKLLPPHRNIQLLGIDGSCNASKFQIISPTNQYCIGNNQAGEGTDSLPELSVSKRSNASFISCLFCCVRPWGRVLGLSLLVCPFIVDYDTSTHTGSGSMRKILLSEIQNIIRNYQ